MARDSLIERLKSCLSQFWQAEFLPYSYGLSNNQNHASIKVDMPLDEAYRFVDEVSERLSLKNGYRARLQVIGRSTLQNGKVSA